MSDPRDRLHPRLRGALERCGAAAGRQGFRLAGGTALTLHLGHRRSDDLDWFSTEKLEDPLRLSRRLADEGVELGDLSVERGTLHGKVADVPVSFLEFPYPDLAPAQSLATGGSMLSLDDIAAMKLLAIAQRGARKDFLDLWAIVSHHRPLGDLLELFAQKFGAEIAPVLYGLAYRADAEREPLPELLVDVSWDRVVADIDRWLGEVAAR